MIESRYWKNDLLTFAKYLENQKGINKWSEKAQVLFEKKLIINFFIIRKLVECEKISDRTKIKKYKLRAYQKNLKKLTNLNFVSYDEQYNLDKFDLKLKDINFICNQLIHSLTIFALRKSKKWNSVLACSDYEKNKWIYEIDIETIIEIMKDFGNNYVEKINYKYNESKKDYDIILE